MSKPLVAFVTESEAVTITGLKRTSLYLLRKDGTIRWTTRKSGRGLRYHPDDLKKLISA